MAASTTYAPPTTTADALAAVLTALYEPGSVFEIRALKVPGRGTVSGYYTYDQRAQAARHVAAMLDGKASGVYATVNPVQPDLLARAANRLRDRADVTTQDSEIVRRHWLPLDLDPKRPAGISASDAEHAAALGRAEAAAGFFAGLGWPEPIRGDSGNGGHLLYRIDLPNNAESRLLIERVLKSLAGMLDDPQDCTPRVVLDTSVGNAARIWKLYPTWAKKGDDLPERPHRRSRLLSVPERLEVVTREQLEALCELPEVGGGASAQTTASASGRTPGTPHGPKHIADVGQYLARHGLAVVSERQTGTAHVWVLAVCAWNAAHTDHSAIVMQFPTGDITAKCSHNSCGGKGLAELRDAVEPGWRDHARDSQNGHHSAGNAGADGTTGNADSNSGADSNGTAAGPPLAVDVLGKEADDAGNAAVMQLIYGKQFIYSPAFGWLHWSGTHWQAGADALVRQAAVDTLRRRRHAAVDAKMEAIIRVTKADRSRVEACVDLFGTLVTVTDTATFDAEPDVLNCQDGVLDLRTGTVAPHDPRQRLTYVLPVAWDPTADMAEWVAFIREATGQDEEQTTYIQTCAGYSLTAHTREEKLFYLFGPPRSGKGTFSETLLELLPRPLGQEVDFNSFTARRDNDNQNFDLADLKPARLVFASESNKYQTLNPAKIKQVTGGNYLRCAHKYKAMFSYRPQFKVWLVSNHEVNGDPDDDALWGRVQVFTFPHSHLGAEDTALKERLKQPDNLRGVLRWAVEGAQRWYAQGLQPPEVVNAATAQHREKRDDVKHWLDDCCTWGKDAPADAWTPSSALMASYREWCEANTVTPITATTVKLITANELASTLTKRFGCVEHRDGKARTRGYLHIALGRRTADTGGHPNPPFSRDHDAKENIRNPVSAGVRRPPSDQSPEGSNADTSQTEVDQQPLPFDDDPLGLNQPEPF